MRKRWWVVIGAVVAAVAYAAAPPQVQIALRSLPRRLVRPSLGKPEKKEKAA